MARSKLTPPVKNAKNGKMRSSPEARRLIRAYVKEYGSQHRAAKAMHMTQAQLNGILTGRLRDTPAMRIAIDRADNRAKRAWLKVDHQQCTVIDAPATLRAIHRALTDSIDEAISAKVMIEQLMRMSEQ